MFKAHIIIKLRPSILDPQGKAMQNALHDLGQASISQVRAGKHIEMMIDVEASDEARRIATQACEQLLANAVMEDFDIQLVEVSNPQAA